MTTTAFYVRFSSSLEVWMKVYKGTTRIVVAFPSLGIAVKIARIRCIEAVKRAVARFRMKTKDPKLEKRFIRNYFSWRMQVPSDPSFWNLLLVGLVSNLFEWKYTLQNGATFTAPTYVSCGLFSIIRYAEPLPKMLSGLAFGFKVRKAFDSIMPEHIQVSDSHHLTAGKNFGYINGKLVICDYGSAKTQAILRSYAKQLDALDLATVLRSK